MTSFSRTLFFALALALALAAPAQTPVDPGVTYDTRDLIVKTVKALPRCIKYCLLGFEIRIRYTGFTVEVYLVPRVEHHMVALHAMTSDRFPEEAYREWAGLVGEIQKKLLDKMAHLVPVALGGTSISESGGGRSRKQQYGEHQSTNFKEAEYMGHPVAILPALVDKNGDMTADTYTDGETGGTRGTRDTGHLGGNFGQSASDATGFIDLWSSWSVGCFMGPDKCSVAPAFPSGVIGQVLRIEDWIDTIIGAVKGSGVDFKNMSKVMRELGNKLADNAGAGGGVKIDRLLCPNDVYYFFPYYLSGVDALFWRSGAPITDIEHLLTMINPFSGDRIGTGAETWAHIYPRHGFVNNDHPGRVAPAIAARGANLLADEKVKLRPKLTTAYARGDWQNLSPQATEYCASNIADLPTPVDPEGGYGHNIWPYFQCPLSEIGFFVGFIPLRYCFTGTS